MNQEQLRDQARATYDRLLAKQNLKTLMTSRLTVTHRDGVFPVNTELFVLLNLLPDDGWNDEMIILDMYDTPVMVNRMELLTLAKRRYVEVMNEWQQQYQEQTQVRNAQQL
jgi:hypothetical protein